MLFHVVNDRHRKKRTMIFTTNKPLTGWGRVLHDDDLAHAIVDRILERGRVLTLDGPSMRTRHLGLDDPTAIPASTQSASLSEGARISGIQRPEFPEPTARSIDRIARRSQKMGLQHAELRLCHKRTNRPQGLDVTRSGWRCPKFRQDPSLCGSGSESQRRWL